MSKDDAGPKRPPRDDDASYITMPPELRPFAKPMAEKVIKPGDDPILDAAVAGIKVLDGDPDADPFYYDVKKRRAQANKKEGAGAGNAAAYVAPTSIPSASEVKAGDAAPAKVVIAELDDPLSTRAIDVRAFRGRSGASRGAPTGGGDAPAVDRSQEPAGDTSEKPLEAASSPWSKEAAPPESVRSSALPSSLRPRDPAAPASEKPAAQPAPGRTRTTVAFVVALVLVALGIGVRALTTRRTPESGSQGPAPTAPPTVTPQATHAVVPPAPSPTPPPTPPPASASEPTSPVAPPSATAAPPTSERHHPAPRLPGTTDPYDAAVKPLPAPTAPPQATANPATPVAAPHATATTNPFDKPNYD